MGLLSSLSDPRISRHLLREEGEVIVDEVGKHWAALTRPFLEGAAGVALLCVTPFLPVDIAWLPLLVVLVLAVRVTWGVMSVRVDRFVITNMRVFRVHGVVNRKLSTMPLTRILDISVTKPLLGRLLGYGHFVFESAAQEQGLRDVRFVGRPDERDLVIQGVVQRAGLRGPRVG
ncbi:PH domain-containing protein [Nocardioides sp. GY 10127]|uniref:PH domain-containing protein n=1 Tax=Nocardioides sp. GY 10127 TaxID=2569762 RepID=UPI0010A8A109|nr:PH domain-containing protein [Nocardioides sp. GY 10127]TIC84031.1 PH domain-containing protein [Nocardioides sp. GY 10127]